MNGYRQGSPEDFVEFGYMDSPPGPFNDVVRWVEQIAKSVVVAPPAVAVWTAETTEAGNYIVRVEARLSSDLCASDEHRLSDSHRSGFGHRRGGR